MRKRVTALAGLVAVGYSLASLLDLALRLGLEPSGFASAARLKNVGMALVAWWLFFAARRGLLSIRALTPLAYVMVFLMGLHQTLESLHFFQWPNLEPVALEPGRTLEGGSLVEGLTWTCLLMVLFPPFVPGSPRRQLGLALGMALPLLGLSWGWALLEDRSYWAILSPETFASVLICLFLSFFMSLAIHRLETALREERRRSRELGSYELVRELGQGGMGQVWLARHRMLARPAALKLIKPERIQGPAERSADVLRRFEREARATAHLRSAHTVELYDFGRTEAGDLYYVMEYLDGMDLDALVSHHGPQPVARVVRILRQVCLSLLEAHDQGLIHRDIKPANIFLCRQGAELDVVKVLDFGLVAGVPDPGAKSPSPLTRDNDVLGTPAFMAPESVVDPAQVDHRADLYAWGCVGYWLLAGRCLFEEKTLAALVYAHVHKALPSPLFPGRDPDVPPGLEALLVETLAKDPEDRPGSARELLVALERLESEHPRDEESLRRWWEAVPRPAVDPVA
jgi:serine/threonine-protein kinase